MPLVASVSLSISRSVCKVLLLEPFDQRSKVTSLCIFNQRAYTDNCTDAVDQLLIIFVCLEIFG